MATAHDRLAAKVARLETTVRGLATGPQMGYSSLENANFEEYDGDGQLVSIVGKQPDGTHGAVVVSGPNPPRPSAPIVSGGPGLLNFGWDGSFADEVTGATDITIPAPLDWARAEAHASPVQGFLAESAGTLLDTLESPRGGSRTAMLEPGVWYVVLVSRALSGKRSVQSREVSVEVLAPVGSDVDVEALRDEFRAADDELNATIIRNKQAQDTLAGTVGTLQNTTLPALDSGLALANTRLASARTELDMLTGVAPLPDVYAQHIASYTAAFQRVDIKNLFVTGDSALNTLTAQRIAASVASFLQVSTDQLIAGTANIGTAVVDKLFAEMFATRKLFANQVVIGEPGNIHPDPNFLDPAGWTISTGYSILEGGGRNGNNALDIAASSTQMGKYYGNTDRKRQFRVTGGSTYRLSVWVKTGASVPINGVALYSKWTNPGTALGGVFTSPASTGNKAVIPANTWVELTHEFPLPADATNVFIGLYAQATANTRVLFSEPSVKEVVTPSLIVDGFFQGLRVIGANIETNAAAGVGVKLNDDGLVAHGTARVSYNDGGIRDTKMRAVLDSRVTKWSSGAQDKWPGLWLESSPVSGAAPLTYPAGVTVGGSNGISAILQSASEGASTPYSEVRVSPGTVTVQAVNNVGGMFDQGLASLGLSRSAFGLGARGNDGQSIAYVSNELNNGVLQLYGKDGVTVNGNNIVPKAWTNIPMNSGQAPLDGNRPAVRIDSTGQFLEFTGGITCGPNGARPAVTFMTISSAIHRPATFKNFVVATSVGPQGLTIAPSGAMYLNPTGMQTGGWIDLSQLRFSIAGPQG